MKSKQAAICPKMGRLIGVFLALTCSSTASALGSRCYVDVYEYAEYVGAHIRIEGPTKLRNLRSVNGENWDSRIDSLIVGPNARVRVYENPNYKMTLSEISKHPDLMRALGITAKDVSQESELEFGPNEKIHHLGEYNFHRKTRSIKIDCLK